MRRFSLFVPLRNARSFLTLQYGSGGYDIAFSRMKETDK